MHLLKVTHTQTHTTTHTHTYTHTHTHTHSLTNKHAHSLHTGYLEVLQGSWGEEMEREGMHIIIM